MTVTVPVSIILLVKNGDRYLRSLLDGIHSQNIGNTEVIVIDSGSSDGSLDIVADFPALRLYQISPSEFGHGKTRNLGARLARGEFLVYIPQDATPIGQEWLTNLLRPFEDPSVAGVYARQVPREEASAMERYFLSEIYDSVPAKRKLALGEVPTLARCFFSTVSGAVRASVWERHPFREDIIMSEDQAWAAEVMQAGHSIAYEPSSCVMHSHQYGVVDIFRRNFDSGYSVRQIFACKTGITFSRAFISLARESNYVLRHGPAWDWVKFLPYEAARHIGFFMGMHAEKLPVSMCKRFSSLRYFWEHKTDPGAEG